MRGSSGSLPTPSAVWYSSALVLPFGRDLTSRLARILRRSQRLHSISVTAGCVHRHGTVGRRSSGERRARVVHAQQMRRATSAALTGLAGTARVASFPNAHRAFSQQPNKVGGPPVAIVKPQAAAAAGVRDRRGDGTRGRRSRSIVRGPALGCMDGCFRHRTSHARLLRSERSGIALLLPRTDRPRLSRCVEPSRLAPRRGTGK
jgi:hypothetical protein